MGQDDLRYDRMVEEALRGVVRQALRIAESGGLPGDHHYYLTFRSADPGVEMSPALRAQYPREMTIVLQHQFWGLEVGELAFSVTLSFGGRHERLVVPYNAVVSFADPSVKFGLQFEAMGTPDEDQPEALETEGAAKSGASKMPVPAKPAGLPVATAAEPTGDARPTTREGGQVVALDAFRKK